MSSLADPLEIELRKLGSDRTIERARAADDPDVVDRYLDVAGRHAQSDVALATAALEVCESLAAEWGRPDLAPEVHYLQARLALMQGRAGEALDLIDRARSEWLSLDQPAKAYRTDLGRMNVLDDLGEHIEAIRTGELLLENLSRLPDQDSSESDPIVWMRAAALENLGAAYGYTGRHHQALEAYETAELGYQRVGSPSDVARCRANRGVELISIGQARLGIDAVDHAARIFDEVDDRHSYAKCLGHRAEGELLLGHYTRCLDRFVEARRIFERLDARPEAARLAVKTMRAYLALNLIDEAVDVGRSVAPVLADLGLRHDLAEAQWLTAVALLADGQVEAAMSKLDAAVDGARASADQPLEVRAGTSWSEALSMTGRHAEALAAAEAALDVAGRGTWPTEEWELRVLLSRLTDGDRRADHVAAADRLAAELGLPLFRYGVLIETGRLHRDCGEYDEAVRLFEEAVDVVEELRGFISNEGARTSFLQGRASAHSELISVLTADADPQSHRRAFDVAQRAKARTLSDLLAGTTGVGSNSRTGSESMDAEFDLQACYNALIAGGQGLSQTRRRAILGRAAELETRIRRARFEEDTGPRSTPAGGVVDPAASAVPDDDEQVVEFHFVGRDLIAFVWSGGEMALITGLPTLDQCRGLVRDWARQLERFRRASQLPGRPIGNLVASAEEVLQRMWAQLFSPVAGRLDRGGELLIIPHGPLSAVPFHALIGPDGRIGDHHGIATAASYAVADSLRRRPAQRDRAVGRSVVVGVADAAAPAVAAEASAVAALLDGSDLLLNGEATIDAFRSAFRHPVDVAHIACHGLHRAHSPMFSSLRLADGWLTAHDVLSISVNADLVVLSACESGRLDSDRVLNEPVGLARSFLAAGARAVVVSLWLAHDEATLDLMTRFHENLNQGSTPVVALQTARSAVADTNPHPAAWAPFIIHGGLPPKGDR